MNQPLPPEITELFDYARRQRKGDWHAYAKCRRRLDGLKISDEQHQDAHEKLIRILKV